MQQNIAATLGITDLSVGSSGELKSGVRPSDSCTRPLLVESRPPPTGNDTVLVTSRPQPLMDDSLMVCEAGLPREQHGGPSEFSRGAFPTESMTSRQGVNDDRFITPLQQVICSCAGAFVTSTCTTPLDVIKIRLQAQQKAMIPSSLSTSRVRMPSLHQQKFLYNSRVIHSLCLCTECSFVAHPPPNCSASSSTGTFNTPKFSGAWDALLKISRTEGLRVLWSGLPTTWLMAVPATVVYFTTYDRLKYKLGYKEGNSSTLYIPVLAGSIARVGAATIVSPLELIRTKMQSTVLSYSELRRSVAISIRNNGVLFMMSGLGPSLLRDVPFSAIYWFGYETVKAYNLRNSSDSKTGPGFLLTFVAGAISGTIAAVLTLPFDVIKTHRQIELGEAGNRGGAVRLTSTWMLISELYRRNGIGALYAGLVPRVMKVAPACAIMISIYECGKSYFRARNSARDLYN